MTRASFAEPAVQANFVTLLYKVRYFRKLEGLMQKKVWHRVKVLNEESGNYFPVWLFGVGRTFPYKSGLQSGGLQLDFRVV